MKVNGIKERYKEKEFINIMMAEYTKADGNKI
jgi:hypothetical protein